MKTYAHKLKSLKRSQLEALYILKREELLRIGRLSFWVYCKNQAPDFYKENRWHLKVLCKTLQDFYEGKLLDENGKPYRKLMLNVVPRFGKTRTLVLFCQWVLGIEQRERILCCSYNDDEASDFSRYVRDGIDEDVDKINEIVHRTFFPDCLLKGGNKSYKKWALEGQYFNYKGAGIGGVGIKVVSCDESE